MISYIKKAVVCMLSFVMLLALTACGKDEKGTEILTGNKWTTSSGTLLEINDDGTFKWFNSKADRKNNYYSGDADVKSGQDAIDFLVESEDFSEDVQRSSMNQFSVEEDNYYAVVLTNKECIQDGENTLEKEYRSVYYGYYNPEYETLKLFGLNSMTTFDFTKM